MNNTHINTYHSVKFILAIIIKDWSHAGDTHSNVITVKRSTHEQLSCQEDECFILIHNICIYMYTAYIYIYIRYSNTKYGCVCVYIGVCVKES